MKKNKNPEQAFADFKNNPFKLLKGVSVKPGSAQKKTEPLREKKVGSTTEEDSDLFLRAMAGARRIDDTDGPAVLPPKQATTTSPDPGVQEDNQLFLQAMRNMGPKIQALMREPEQEETARRSSSSRVRQLKRGTIRISQELDLHGFLKDEALKQLEYFIAAAFGQGHQAVLVITGKGTNSPEGPVLQGAVATWLQSKGKGMVAEFSSAPRDKGGSGAFVVFLKKK